MPFVLGIDEAGYGPLLGPLLVCATAWEVASDAVGDNFWKRLEAVVAPAADRHESRLVVGDSKQVFDRHRGLASLERPVLAFASACGMPTHDLAALLGALGVEPPGDGAMPWYSTLHRALPTDPVQSAFEGAAERLAVEMSAAGVTCRALLAQVVTEERYNGRVAATRNKASVLLEQVLKLLERGRRLARDDELHVIVDRLGGRSDYRRLLMDAFPDRPLHILAQTDVRSAYRVCGANGDWFVEFCVDADRNHLPVALASMLAKYVRELLMEQFNAFWRGLAPELRPTAGYYQDAQRFLTDIAPHAARAGIEFAAFVRQR